jgi:hypothetical protein
MKKIFSAVLSLITMGLISQWGWAVEPTWNYAVQVSATVQLSPPQISLSWPQDTTAIPSSYTVYRKAPGATSWGTGTTLAGSATTYVDTSATVGTAYEYQVVKAASGYTGYGYIQTGISVPLVENRGKVILIVDNTYASQLSAELNRLQQDLAGDGWTVLRHDVARNDSVVNVKNLIKADYNADSANVKAVFLFGHAPVPYSGLLNPDGHADHYGAWPADVYYGDMDGNWTDSSVNYTQNVNTDPADAARLSNVPGDGKFDQTTIPSPVELQVGRVDLANMPGRLTWGGPPSFPNEQELLRQYLNKDHNFRHKLVNVQRRALLGDYFGVRSGEAFAASGFRSFTPLVGANNIANLNVIYNDQKGKWIPELAANDYLLAYGCGAGSYWTLGGLGNSGQYNDGSTTEVVGNNARAVFTLLFGSWNGDWDHEDNIMRSILATRDYGLACAWSGRPHWFMHHMGLGETIGYCARATQNNTGLYKTQIDSSANQIHVALMGDPTLRLHPVTPPGTLGGTAVAGSVTLTWTPSPDSLLGYHVYRATSAAGPFTRVTGSLLAATTFVDTSAPSGATYMVRAVKLESTPSGSYYNASQGLFWTTGGTPPPPPPTLPTVTVTATDANAAEAGQDPAVFTFTRTGSTASALTVNYDLTGTATKWNDYRRFEGDMPTSITIPAGATSAALTVYPVDDTEVEGTENVILTILSDTAYTVGSPNSATATIADNDSGSTLPVVTVAATDASAAEAGLNPGVFTITRNGATTVTLTVNFTLSGTASGSDYAALGTTVTLPIGVASSTVVVTPVDDSAVESTETVVLTLSSSSTYTVGSPNSATVTIVDNDSTTPPPTVTNTPPNASTVDYTNLKLPQPGDHTLHILSPTLLELRQINTKNPDPAPVDSWDFVDANNQFVPPALTQFVVTVDGAPAVVQAVGFKRRPLYAPVAQRDLRIDNCLYLQLAAPVADNQTVEVKNPTALLWPTSVQYVAKAEPFRYSPAIHVNQEGYVPSFSKKAMVGYYLGSMGEMNIAASLGFKVVDTATGTQIYQGSLTSRPDVGYVYTATPYQKVLEADFSNFTTPGAYRLVVPGLGASLPFLIDDGVAMGFTRTYALGLYHQRCGASNVLPYTRFTHNVCHVARAEVPSPQSSYSFTWTTIASKNADYASNPRHTAPQLKDEASQLYPFVNKGTVDVSGGHHDAGDYSKYTINGAALVHRLMFTSDSIPGAAALDNLGLPESGDGISDVLQEAKWEADFIAKMQDADGGFYFIVYPKNREYESNVTPDNGDTQVVWPKNTAVTAASVAALAQCASSPRFKQAYPAAASLYLQKAQLGWQFLMNAIATHGKDGSYQKVTFYGDHYMHDDELAWAACEMYLATGEAQYQQKLLEWFPDPSDPNTFMWGWWRMSESWGNAIRSYAFAARSGRLSASQLNGSFLAKCEAQITAAGDDALRWSQQSAYGSAFPEETKHVRSAGWYFSLDQASDMAVADLINPRPEYINALVGNMNYEGGCNPVNVTYVTGLGWKRPREIVHQYAQNDRRLLPQSGIPQGNVQASFDYLYYYGSELGKLSFPQDGATTSPYPFYDRWGDSFNVTTEFVSVNQSRSLMALALLASQTSAKSTAWTSASAQITVPTSVVPVNEPITLTLQASGLDLRGARIVWEARDQEPAYGSTYTISPKNNGAQWAEAEVQWPDGRRVFATGSFNANSPTVTWVDETLPAGAQPASEGGDGWNWIMASPTAFSGTKAHQSNLAAGQHGHWFDGATATLEISTGDTMFAYVYLDPASVPSEVMLMWNNGDWEHRAYWGANNISYGSNGTASRRYMGALPAAGQWARLEVPANQVGLEGSLLKGMAFCAFDGRTTWDAAGKTSQTNTPLPTVTVVATDASASEAGSNPGVFTITRTGTTASALTVNYTLGGTASNGTDYNTLGTAVTIPAGAASATVTVIPNTDSINENTETVVLTLTANASYTVGLPNSATVNIANARRIKKQSTAGAPDTDGDGVIDADELLAGTDPNDAQSLLKINSITKAGAGGITVSWPTVLGKIYRVSYAESITDEYWTDISDDVVGTGAAATWTDTDVGSSLMRIYVVTVVN